MRKIFLAEEEREKSFIGEMNFTDLMRYKKPFAVIMSGLPGSGKTHMARTMSRELGIFLLSSDYVRNYYYSKNKDRIQEIARDVERGARTTNLIRQGLLILGRFSFVLDRDFNDGESIEKYRNICNSVGYDMIGVSINSPDHDENKKRIAGREFDLDYVIEGVRGDNRAYDYPYGGSSYDRIVGRKPRSLEGINFDYVLNNTGIVNNFDAQIGEVVEDIKNKHTR